MAIIAQSTSIIFEIEDNYQKQTYRNRAYITHSNGKLLLNVPILHSKKTVREKTKEVEVENSFPWQAHHWKSIQSAYRSSPYFEFYEDDLVELFKYPVVSLLDHNINIFRVLCDLIDIETPHSFSEEYLKDPEQVDFRGIVNVKETVSVDFPYYNQVLENDDSFIPNLSILDLLFNEGPNTLTYLENLKIDF